MMGVGEEGHSKRQPTAWRRLVLCLVIGSLFLGCNIGDSHDADYNYNHQTYPYSPGWYQGVLHSHALYDAGAWITPIASVVGIAEEQGFDFLAITNHNAIFQWADPGYQSRALTVLYGVEWTTSQGHANIWSNQPFAFQIILATIGSADARSAIRTVHDLSTRNQPLLFSINHPNRLKSGQPSWEATYDDSQDADAIEVWNRDDIFVSDTDAFTAYISQGGKMTMVGGSDAHLKEPDAMASFSDLLGQPTTWVYADSRSGEDILRGIEQGHVFISATPEGPELDFFAGSESERIMMGDTIPADEIGQEVGFTVWVSNDDPPYGVVVIKNGVPQEAWSRTFAAAENTFTFTDSPQSGDYYRLEIHQLASQTATFDELLLGSIRALSNPIYTW
jgi:hypothetical protein